MKPINTDDLRVAKVEMVNGAPALTIDGRPIPMMTYQWQIREKTGLDDDPSHDSRWQAEGMIKAGVELFFAKYFIDDPVNFEKYWDDFMAEMKMLTEIKPDILIMPWITIRPYAAFADKYPGEVIHFEDGSIDKWNSARHTALKNPNDPRFTYASTAFKHEVGGMLRDFIRRLLASPYRRNVAGYFFFLFDQEASWFFEFDATRHAIDYSPAMHQAFRNFLIEKYHGDVTLLRKAWKDESVTFETAQIPGVQRRTTGDFGYFRDPSASMQVYDYVQCHNDECAEKLLYLARCCKEETDFKHVVGSFWGYLQNQDIQLGGQTQMKKVMDSPYLDFWASPFTYENRCAGNFPSLRMALKTLNKHGKMYFAEVDTFLSDSPLVALSNHNYPDQTRAEDRATLIRDFVYPFCEGCNGWWIDWCAGTSQYTEDGLRAEELKIREVGQEGFTHPRGPVSDVAAVIDQESLHAPACNSMNHDDRNTRTGAVALMRHSLQRFRIDELPRIGTTVDFYETDDVIDGEGRKYRMYIFLNQYIADARERQLIEERLKRDGNVLVWIYGAGLIDPSAERTLCLENAQALTGFRLGCDMREARSIMTARGCDLLPSLTPGEKLGDYLRLRVARRTVTSTDQKDIFVDQFGQALPEPNLVYPMIWVDDPDAIPLATFDDGGKVGFAMKRFGDWTSVYVGSPCMQAHVLRDLAKLAGAHIYVDADDIIFANESYVGIHTAEAGMHTFRLPGLSDVKEVFLDREMGRGITSFTEDIGQHETRLYRVLPHRN